MCFACEYGDGDLMWVDPIFDAPDDPTDDGTEAVE